MADVAIIGLGPVGLSLAQATTRAFSGVEIIGFDPDKERVRRARDSGVLQLFTDRIAVALKDASLVILDAPLGDAAAALESIGQLAPPSCVVTDTCYLKRPILDWATKFLPPSIGFVGGHLMVEPSDDDYLVSTFGVKYCLVCDARTSPEAIGVVTALASAAGAIPLFMDADEHDSFVIASKLLPKIASNAAIDAVIRSPVWKDIQNLAGDSIRIAPPGFSLGNADDVSLHDIGTLGRDNLTSLLFWMERLQGELRSLKNSIWQSANAGERFDFEALEDERFQALKQRALSNDFRLERSGVKNLLLGDWLASRTRQD